MSVMRSGQIRGRTVECDSRSCQGRVHGRPRDGVTPPHAIFSLLSLFIVSGHMGEHVHLQLDLSNTLNYLNPRYDLIDNNITHQNLNDVYTLFDVGCSLCVVSLSLVSFPFHFFTS